MNLRKFSSICLFVSALVVTITGITLYFGIGGHVLSLMPHIYFSIPFVIALVLHIVINFNSLKLYIKSKTSGLTKEFALNVAIAVLFTLVSAFAFSKANIKSEFEYPSIDKIPLTIVFPIEGVDGAKALSALLEAGYIVPEKADLTLRDLAEANQKNPRALYTVMTAGLKAEKEQ
ncbi:MAG: DUF4405 domain-containing protein [Deferribacteraceae bacterium]|jgi:hypothetical protein|nr:DUF4405 domain-containing protein [Deferribacteraceae bacterium]